MSSIGKTFTDRIMRSERGVALVTTLGVLLIAMGVAVAVTMSVTVNTQQSNRDRNVKRALAAAEAGVNEATYRMNMLQPTSGSPCVGLSGGVFVRTAAPGPGEWCTAQALDFGNGSTAQYQISPYASTSGVVTRSVVSKATVNGASRRVMVTTSANTGAPLFEPFGMSSNQTMTLSGNANLSGAARSNNDINMSGNARVCGTGAAAHPGPGHAVHLSGNAEVCGGDTTPASAPFVLTPVDQGDAPTNNDNNRLAAGGADTRTTPGYSWTAATRRLSLSSNSTLTMGGHTYSLCTLSVSGNAQLIIAASAVVRIFIDSTSNCGLAAGYNQLSVSGNGKLINTSQDPTHLQIYMVGGTPGTPNSASLSGNAVATQLAFYAPYTNLSMSGNSASYSGAFLANQINVSGNGAAVTYNSAVESITAATIGVYRHQKFIECTPTSTGNTPDGGC